MVPLLVLAVFLLWGAVFQPPQTDAFKITHSDASLSHQEITETAILAKAVEVCRNIAKAQGKEFTLPVNSKLTPVSVQKACSSSSSLLSTSNNLKLAIVTIYGSNAAVDIHQLFKDPPHFDNEKFTEGRDIITKGIAKVKVNLKEGKYLSARENLGALTHTLQDFYSHSNWVELGYTVPYRALIKPDLPLNNTAGPTTATCKSCVDDDCSNNILPEILQQKILTTGYTSLKLPVDKPDGKCSHGGLFDFSSYVKPTGGINKDSVTSAHGFLHLQAANMAINATLELLEDIRLAAGETAFLRLMGLSRTIVLVFVIDITGSMSEEMAEVKKVTINIIDSRKGTSDEPSEYMLITFDDTGVELTRTINVDTFKEKINSLSASGGGDFPEMTLSGLLLALTRAPPSSDIFVFTDASAKDPELQNTVEAMIESTESTVTFLLTSSISSRVERAVSDTQNSTWRPMNQSEVQLYRDLSHVSGGQTLEVTNTTLSEASSAIASTFTSGHVTVIQVVRSAGNAGNFSFLLDSSLSNVTVYITGTSPVFTLYSPTGVSQSDSVIVGSLGSVQTVGNLKKIKLNYQTGEWSIFINSTSSYTLRVLGQSSVDVFFYFVTISQGNHGETWGQIFTRPSIGQNATMFLSVTGGESASVTDLILVDRSGSVIVNGTVKSVGGTDYLVSLDKIPVGAFGIRLKGLLNSSLSSSRFQRQSFIHHKGSRITLTVQTENNPMPGVPFSFNFTVATNTTAGNYTIRARTSNGFNAIVPNSLKVEAGGSVQGTGTLTVPSNTEIGTGVTLIVEAEAPGSTDMNYVTVRLSASATSIKFNVWYSFSLFLSLFGLFVSFFLQ